MIKFDYSNIFQMGWNHHLDNMFPKRMNLFAAPKTIMSLIQTIVVTNEKDSEKKTRPFVSG